MKGTKRIKIHRWDAYAKRIPTDRPVLGAEVGVWAGNNASKLLALRPNLSLLLVDRWEPPTADDSYWKSDKTSQLPVSAYEQALQDTKQRTAFARDRITIVRKTSVDAAAAVADASLDFVLIDGDHSYEGVKTDIRAWLGKIKPGGLICGHDWKKKYGVSQAVTELLDTTNLELDDGSTWFVRLP